MQAGTFVRITQFKPRKYAVEGILLEDVQLGKPVYLAGMQRNGDLVDGTYASAPVDGVSPQGFTAAGALYGVEVLGFAAPFVVVRRRTDQKLGSLLFQHHPRLYFDFKADQ
jgi:hypothetical protein